MKVADVLADRFEVERLAGAGGMGQVFRAKDRLTGQPVALKVLVGEGGDSRFLREAKVLAKLDHPGIVRHVAHGTTPDGQAYIAMEWLEGETLSARLRRARLTDAEAIEVVSRLCDALAAAHRLGVVHRDVKPGNVILVDGRIDRPKLLDFGIAHLSDASAVMTRTGAVLGTVGYMAPEQARGVRGIDARADVFALGAMLFHCLTGRPPFSGGGAIAVLAKLVLEEPPRLSTLRPDLPPALDELMARLLAKEPAGRPVDAAAVAQALAGIRLGRAAPSAPPTVADEALTGVEQRLVAVLLASAVGDAEQSEWGSTAFESLGSSPSSVAADAPARTDGHASGRVVREARKVVARFGARLEPLRSGSLAVVLSGGGSATDLGARAARCGLALRQLLPSAPMVLAIGRGVVAGAFPIGEAIDRAAELLPSAPAARLGIGLDGVTAGLLDTRFEVEEGLLLRERAAETTRKLMGRPTTTVGRERELRFLEGMLDECVSEPVARAVLVLGPAGIGKSRIRHDFVRQVSGRGGVEVWMARGDPMSAGSPFGLLAQALRRTWGVQDGEPAPASRARLEAWLAQRFAGADLPRLAGFLGELARLGAVAEDDAQLAAARRDPVLMGDQIRRAFEDVVLERVRRGPLLVVLEDLHWGDLPSVNLMDGALRVAKELPLMVLALARPEVRDTFPGLWAQRDLAELRLGALTRKASERLVREVLGDGVDAETLARIVERADGNAFYLEELIRSVAEGDAEKLPETVLAMVQSRLEALPDGARSVLRAASVFGGVFWDGGVTALIGAEQSAEETREWLGVLAERELVTTRAESRFPGRAEYVFRHALVREAAYSMLTPQDCERGHRRAGAWLAQNGETDALLLAQHFDRGRDPQRALAWTRTAAEEALAGNDFVAAERAVLRARELAAEARVDSPVEGELALLEGEILHWMGRHAEAGQRGARALELLMPGSDAWYSAASLVTVAAHRAGDLATERALAQELLDDGWVDCPGVAALMACSRIATAILQTGDYALADALFEHIDAWAPTLRDAPGALARWQASRAARALFKGFTWDYRVLSEAAAAACEQVGDQRAYAIHCHNAGHACLELGLPELAESRLRETLRLAQHLGVRNVAASTKNNLAAALTALGRYAEARALLEEAIAELSAQGDRRMEGGARNHLAELHLLQGDADAALAEAERAVTLLAHVPPTLLHAKATVAHALLAAGRDAEALDLARSANEQLEAVGSIADGEGRLRLALAEALLRSGDAVGAREVAERAHARLAERAATISDPDVRHAFLERIPAHRRLAEIARS